MAWTAPRTWTTGEVVTAAIMNTHIRDNELFLRAHHGCRLRKSATQSLTSNAADTYTSLTFDVEDYDTDTLHDTVTNNQRITVPTALDGYWLFGGIVSYASSTVGARRDAVLEKTGSGTPVARVRGDATLSASIVMRVHISTAYKMVGGTDYMILGGNQDSGGALNVQSGADETHFWGAYVGN